ncbi:hypothetical protein BJ508DRAFT_314981 [Ascobolus immersus RN42]|uniref:DUF6532 domain-containing protein n=1 Tax=Ascobolus immersus RN42 TaxID=1160509 RepID=A0A3N4HCR8_ASCIM|nr:hypothetical protein BJ508DRAFT_314981 [Ascobolus immersus RN42]
MSPAIAFRRLRCSENKPNAMVQPSPPCIVITAASSAADRAKAQFIQDRHDSVYSQLRGLINKYKLKQWSSIDNYTWMALMMECRNIVEFDEEILRRLGDFRYPLHRLTIGALHRLILMRMNSEKKDTKVLKSVKNTGVELLDERFARRRIRFFVVDPDNMPAGVTQPARVFPSRRTAADPEPVFESTICSNIVAYPELFVCWNQCFPNRWMTQIFFFPHEHPEAVGARKKVVEINNIESYNTILNGTFPDGAPVYPTLTFKVIMLSAVVSAKDRFNNLSAQEKQLLWKNHLYAVSSFTEWQDSQACLLPPLRTVTMLKLGTNEDRWTRRRWIGDIPSALYNAPKVVENDRRCLKWMGYHRLRFEEESIPWPPAPADDQVVPPFPDGWRWSIIMPRRNDGDFPPREERPKTPGFKIRQTPRKGKTSTTNKTAEKETAEKDTAPDDTPPDTGDKEQEQRRPRDKSQTDSSPKGKRPSTSPRRSPAKDLHDKDEDKDEEEELYATPPSGTTARGAGRPIFASAFQTLGGGYTIEEDVEDSQSHSGHTSFAFDFLLNQAPDEFHENQMEQARVDSLMASAGIGSTWDEHGKVEVLTSEEDEFDYDEGDEEMLGPDEYPDEDEDMRASDDADSDPEEVDEEYDDEYGLYYEEDASLIDSDEDDGDEGELSDAEMTELDDEEDPSGASGPVERRLFEPRVSIDQVLDVPVEELDTFPGVESPPRTERRSNPATRRRRDRRSLSPDVAHQSQRGTPVPFTRGATPTLSLQTPTAARVTRSMSRRQTREPRSPQVPCTPVRPRNQLERLRISSRTPARQPAPADAARSPLEDFGGPEVEERQRRKASMQQIRARFPHRQLSNSSLLTTSKFSSRHVASPTTTLLIARGRRSRRFKRRRITAGRGIAISGRTGSCISGAVGQSNLSTSGTQYEPSQTGSYAIETQVGLASATNGDSAGSENPSKKQKVTKAAVLTSLSPKERKLYKSASHKLWYDVTVFGNLFLNPDNLEKEIYDAWSEASDTFSYHETDLTNPANLPIFKLLATKIVSNRSNKKQQLTTPVCLQFGIFEKRGDQDAVAERVEDLLADRDYLLSDIALFKKPGVRVKWLCSWLAPFVKEIFFKPGMAYHKVPGRFIAMINGPFVCFMFSLVEIILKDFTTGKRVAKRGKKNEQRWPTAFEKHHNTPRKLERYLDWLKRELSDLLNISKDVESDSEHSEVDDMEPEEEHLLDEFHRLQDEAIAKAAAEKVAQKAARKAERDRRRGIVSRQASVLVSPSNVGQNSAEAEGTESPYENQDGGVGESQFVGTA